MSEQQMTHETITVKVRYDDGTEEIATGHPHLIGVLISYAEANGYEITVVA